MQGAFHKRVYNTHCSPKPHRWGKRKDHVVPSPFTIYLIQSAHTDIGYTHPQEQIASMYLDYYDRVLELCRASADAPKEQRFKWVCETFWQVEHYLAARPEREAEFLRYARAGQIEITAGYLHFTDMIDADAYERGVQRAVAFCKRHQLPVQAALHCDINGWPWAVADILAAHDVPFFCSAVHLDSATDPLGRRGSVHYQTLLEWPWLRRDAPFRIPQAFWWQGSQGGKVLHWLGEHYHLGNVLGLSSPHPFHADKTRYFTETDRLTADDLYAIALERVPQYIERLQAAGYPYDALLISTAGFFVDNSPPDDRWLQIIARWNAEHNDIALRTATLGEWFGALQSRTTDNLPTYQVAWPDHWAHGLGSSVARISQARRTQRRRAGVQALVAQAPMAAAYLETALEQERLALEHTFNAWSTTARPGAAINDFQQAAKELTFHRAALYQEEAIGAALRTLLPQPSEAPHLCVWANEQSDTQLVSFDAGDAQLDPARHALVSSDGRHFAIQEERRNPPAFVAALPAQPGLAQYRLAPVEQAARAPVSPTDQTVLENEYWSLSVDPTTGGLRSLRERTSGREWAAPGSYTFGQLVHELVVHPRGRAAVGNLARVIALDVADEAPRRAFEPGPIIEHTMLTISDTPQTTHGPVFDAVTLRGEAARIGRVEISWRCYHTLPLVELVLDWDKRWSDRPEAAYVAFPFAIQGERLLLETGGGFFQPGSHAAGGQLPGTCSSYYTIQRAAIIAGDGGAPLLWLPLDAPLVMPNALDYNRWETEPWDWNGLLTSMPVNHYWHTNFPTSQRGPIRLRYRLISGHGFADTEAAIRAALPNEVAAWR
jgi:hypothetical protein